MYPKLRIPEKKKGKKHEEEVAPKKAYQLKIKRMQQLQRMQSSLTAQTGLVQLMVDWSSLLKKMSLELVLDFGVEKPPQCQFLDAEVEVKPPQCQFLDAEVEVKPLQ